MRRNSLAALRAAKAMLLRRDGKTYEQIAAACGYASKGAAHDAVQRELERTVREAADPLRELENQRLDALHEVYWPKALSGDGWSHDRILAQMERRATLNGLDAPAKIDLHATINVQQVATIFQTALDRVLPPDVELRERVAQALLQAAEEAGAA